MGVVKSIGGKQYQQDTNGDWYEVPVTESNPVTKVVNGKTYQQDKGGNWYDMGDAKKKEVISTDASAGFSSPSNNYPAQQGITDNLKTFKKNEHPFDQTNEQALTSAHKKISEVMYGDNWKDPVKAITKDYQKDPATTISALELTKKSLMPDGFEAKKTLTDTVLGQLEGNETTKMLKDRAAEYDKSTQPLRELKFMYGDKPANNPTEDYNFKAKLYGAAVKSYANEHPGFQKQLDATGINPDDFASKGFGIADGKLGVIMQEYLSNPDVHTYLEKENPHLIDAFSEVAKGLITDNPHFGINQVANKVSRAVQKTGYNNIEPIFNFHDAGHEEMNNTVAKQVLTPEELKIWDDKIKDNQSKYMDEPSLMEGIASGIKNTASGIWNTFTEPFKSTSQTIKDNWEKEASHVSADPEGLSKYLQEFGNTVGLLMTIGATGAVSGLPATAANVTSTVLAFGGDQLEQAKVKYPDNPVKAWTSAVTNTALYAALSMDLFPAGKAKAAFESVQPEISNVVENLTSGAITREAARQELNTIGKKAIDFIGGTLKKGARVSAELTGIAAFNQGLDKIMGLDEFNKYHPDDEIAKTLSSSFVGFLPIMGVAKFGEMRQGNKMVEESLYEAASNPKRYERVINDLSVKDPSLNKDEMLGNLTFLTETKKELDSRGITPKNQKRYLWEAMRDKAIKANKPEDSNLAKQYSENAKSSQEIKEGILNGQEHEDIVTSAEQKAREEQQKQQAETEDAKDDIESLTKKNELDNKEIDIKIKELDKEAPTYEVQKDKLELQRKDKNDEHEKKVKELSKDIFPEGNKIPEQNTQTPTQSSTRVEEGSGGVEENMKQFNLAKEGSIKRIKNSNDPQTIFSEINRLQEGKKATKGAEFTSEEQTIIDNKLKELKDKGYTFKTKKGEILRSGENIRVDDNQTLLKPNEVTNLEKELLKKELDRREKLKQDLIKNGYTEDEAVLESELNENETIDIVSKDLEVTVLKNGIQEKSGKVAIRFISVKDAEQSLKEQPKADKTSTGQEAPTVVKSNKDISKVFNRLLKDEHETENYGIDGLLADWGAEYDRGNDRLIFEDTRSGTGKWRLSKKDFINDILNGKLEKDVPDAKEFIDKVKESILDELGIKKSTTPETEIKTANETEVISETPKEDKRGVVKKARSIEDLTEPKDIVLQYFAGGNKIHPSAIKELFGGGRDERLHMKQQTGGEQRAKISLQKNDAPGIKDLAHKLWERSLDENGHSEYTDRDFRDAIESVLQEHNSPASMSKELVDRHFNKGVKQELTEQEAKDINDGLIAKLQKHVDDLPEEHQQPIIELLSKYQDKYGFVDWDKLEADTDGFDPEILSLPEATQKFLYEITEKNNSTGQGEHSNPVSQDSGKEEKTAERVKVAKSELSKAQKELKDAEDKLAGEQAKQADLFAGGQQKGMFETDPNEVKSILDPFKKKVKEAEAELKQAEDAVANEEDKKNGDLFENQYATGVFAENTDVKESSDNTLKPVDFPELVQVVKSLTDGEYPNVKKLANALGYFSPKLRNIVLDRRLFTKDNYEDLLKTMAHEIGHFVDYIPDETMQRGNILGRIASLKDFMEEFLPFKPGEPGALTKEEMDAITEEVKKAFTRTKVIDEEIETTTGLAPQDILDIWNSVDAGRDKPKLLEYIQGLSDAEKKSIIIKAMKGEVADALKKFGTTVKQKTGKQIVEEFLLKGWKKEIKKRIEDEIAKRRLWAEKKIYDEAYNLSKEWRPFDEKNATKKDIHYRKDSKEVYADMISVLFNSPGTLEEKAPSFFHAFMNYLDSKPEFKAVYDNLMHLLTDPEAVKAERAKNVQAGYKEAELKRKEALKIKKNNETKIKQFKREIVSAMSPLLEKLPEDKFGKKFSEYEKMRNSLEQMEMWKAKAVYLLDTYKNELITPLEKSNISIDDIGELTQYVRNLSPARGDKANPLGFQTEDTNLDQMQRVLDKYSPEQQDKISEVLKKFYETNFEVMQDAYDSGLVTPDMWQEIQKNKYNYATFKPVKYIDDRIQSAAFLNIKGTLQTVANPFLETMLKTTLIQRAATKNRTMLEARDALRKFDPDSIKDAAIDFRGNPARPKTGEDTVIYREGGKLKSFHTDAHIAKIFSIEAPEKMSMALKIVNALSNPLKAAWTRYNPGFTFFSNPIKDSLRTLSNLTAILSGSREFKWYDYLTLRNAEYPKTWFGSIGEARKLLKKEPSELGQEMLKNAAINPESALFSNFNPEYSGVTNVFSHYDFLNKQLGTEKPIKKWPKKIWDALWWIPDKLITGPGQVIEMTSKVAGYKILRKRLGAEQAAYYTRNFVGTPNYSEQTGWNYGWIPFAKVITQGIRNDGNLATKPNTRAGYWIDKTVYTILPAILTGLAMKGVFDSDKDEKGHKLSDWFTKWGKYKRNNFYSIPLGISDGKAGGATIPIDDVSKLVFQMTLNSFEDEKLSDHATDAAKSLINATPLTNIKTPGEIAGAWYDWYVNDVNPYDDYYKRNIIRPRNAAIGGKDAAGDLLNWTANKFGMKIPYYDASQKTTKEKVLAMAPILRRIYSETAIGDQEVLKQVSESVTKEQAIRGKGIDQAIAHSFDKQMDNVEKGDDGIKRIEKSPDVLSTIIKDAFEKYSGKSINEASTLQDKKDIQTIKSKVKLAVNKNISAGMPFAMAIVNAGSKDEKLKILAKTKEMISEAEFEELKKFLQENNILNQ